MVSFFLPFFPLERRHIRQLFEMRVSLALMGLGVGVFKEPHRGVLSGCVRCGGAGPFALHIDWGLNRQID